MSTKTSGRDRKVVAIVLIVIIIVAGCYIFLYLSGSVSGESSVDLSPTPTLSVIFQAVTKEDLNCYFKNYLSVNLPQFQIIDVVGKDFTGEWILIRSEQFADCWIRVDLLDFQINHPDSLPGVSNPPPPSLSLIPTSTSTPTFMVQPTDPSVTPVSPIKLLWKVVTFECNPRGGVNNVVIDLIISGGIKPYTSSPELPVNALPEQYLSITVNSANGGPSGIIEFTVPRSSDFRCRRPGYNPGPPGPIATPALVTNTPKPTKKP